ncbi:Dpi35p [Rhodotorula paludigena]|uniref:Dpi35p n=1 Tax=Rhodotorula paludigena TaxID=86838 RepID=UPI00316E8AA5
MVIRRVLLDAFGTVFSPREPVFQQYTNAARSLGLHVEEDAVKNGFKRGTFPFKQWAQSHPLYGKLSSPPLEAEEWWSNVIADTFRYAGVATSAFEPVRAQLCRSLVRRFWGKEGYELHWDCVPFLRALHGLPSPAGTHRRFPAPGIASNTDPAVSKILHSLGVLAGQTDPPDAGIRAEEIWTTWAIEEDKKDVRFWQEVLRRMRQTSGEADLQAEEVLVVGDELVSDYETPRRAGFRTLLLRRDLAGGEHARASYDDETDGLAQVDSVVTLLDVVEWIRRENGSTV